jgi:chromosome segregation ATPase
MSTSVAEVTRLREKISGLHDKAIRLEADKEHAQAERATAVKELKKLGFTLDNLDDQLTALEDSLRIKVAALEEVFAGV